ncbi:MAG: TonB-dependent receptor plug domain-containing protein, partial [Mariniphaga sp.]
MRYRLIIFLIFLLGTASVCFSQRIDVKADNLPLNDVFIGLRDKYNLQFSFNDHLLAQYKCSVNQISASPEEAVKLLIKGFPLTYHKKGAIFIILPDKKKGVPRNYLLLGQIAEARSKEPLPFSYLAIDGRFVVSDLKGSFSYQASGDSIFHVKISHLGYFILDTVLVAGMNHHLNLIPSVIGLNEIVIKNKLPDRSTQIGNRAGMMRVNHQIARYLPGNDDNSVFTLLRLMPGILASSEQSNGLIIWGSYEGHSRILFDGFTIWGLKSFNEDIDAVNPLIAKEIEVLKGGYDASLGDRVGGVVRIAGKSGSITKPSFSFNINNVTMNGLAELPLWKKSAL